MAGEIAELFTEFLFGEGAMLGLIVILVLLLFLVLGIKYGSIVTIPISCILIVLYWENIASSSIAMWNTIILFFGIILMLLIEVKRK